MTHLDSTTASSPGITLAKPGSSGEFTWLIINLKTTRTRWTLLFPTCMCWSPFTTPGLTLPFRTTVSAALALLSHPTQPGFIQTLKCLSISSAGFTQSLLCFMLPHPNSYFLSIILIANSKQIKRWGWVFLCPMMLCLASSFIWDGRLSSNIKQEAQMSFQPWCKHPTR